jgi:hypothetical protein
LPAVAAVADSLQLRAVVLVACFTTLQSLQRQQIIQSQSVLAELVEIHRHIQMEQRELIQV